MTQPVCIFLDRDGVLNHDRGNYSWSLDHFEILPDVNESLERIQTAGFLIVVITNQAGIAKGIYTKEQMQECHDHLQEQTGNRIDAFYYSPDHPSVTESLSRKPGSLMFEKAIARYNIDPNGSWMVGDSERDIIAAQKMGLRTIQVNFIEKSDLADHHASDLAGALDIILGQ